jgi:hypothetical protein
MFGVDGELENGLEGLVPLEAVFIWRAQAPLTQLVANGISARLAAHVVAHAALHEVGFVGTPEEDKSGAIIGRLAVSGNLPAPLQELLDSWAAAGRVGRRR